jgi:hypothetical protein
MAAGNRRLRYEAMCRIRGMYIGGAVTYEQWQARVGGARNVDSRANSRGRQGGLPHQWCWARPTRTE